MSRGPSGECSPSMAGELEVASFKAATSETRKSPTGNASTLCSPATPPAIRSLMTGFRKFVIINVRLLHLPSQKAFRITASA